MAADPWVLEHLVHQYFGVDIDVVESHLPPLAEALRAHATDG